MAQRTESNYSEHIGQIIEQVSDIYGLVTDEDPWLATVYKRPVSTLISNLQLPPNDSAIIRQIRRELNIANACINYTKNNSELVIDDTKLFGYLHSIVDYIENLDKDN